MHSRLDAIRYFYRIKLTFDEQPDFVRLRFLCRQLAFVDAFVGLLHVEQAQCPGVPLPGDGEAYVVDVDHVAEGQQGWISALAGRRPLQPRDRRRVWPFSQICDFALQSGRGAQLGRDIFGVRTADDDAGLERGPRGGRVGRQVVIDEFRVAGARRRRIFVPVVFCEQRMVPVNG